MSLPPTAHSWPMRLHRAARAVRCASSLPRPTLRSFLRHVQRGAALEAPDTLPARFRRFWPKAYDLYRRDRPPALLLAVKPARADEWRDAVAEANAGDARAAFIIALAHPHPLRLVQRRVPTA